MKLDSKEVSGIFLVIFGAFFISLSTFGYDLVYVIPITIVISAATLYFYFIRTKKKD